MTMLCQFCGKLPATTHITHQLNGQRSEWHVCSSCAVKEGLAAPPSAFSESLFGNYFAQPFLHSSARTEQCPGCKRTYRSIVQEGKVGCPTCYTAFYDRLQPSIERIHGKATHTGKIGAAAGEHARFHHTLDALKAELDSALKAQDYERCAELRDQIKALEEEEQ